MKDYEDAIYNKHFIKQVICRIDFMDFLSSETISSPDITTSIKTHFQRVDADQILQYKLVDVNTAKAAGHTVLPNGNVEGIQLNYIDKCGNKLSISNKFLLIDYKIYDKYEGFANSFKEVISNIFSNNKVTTFRIGLRYINMYNADSIKIKKSFFEKGVANNTQIKQFEYSDEIKLIRSMQLAEYIFENCRLNFRYGLHNPHYPTQLKTSDYVLDFDCYTEEPLKKPDEIILQIKKEHDAIQLIFEQSITDRLRSEMRNE